MKSFSATNDHIKSAPVECKEIVAWFWNLRLSLICDMIFYRVGALNRAFYSNYFQVLV